MLTDPTTHRWAMVTGTPRSGTTFLGDVLSQPISVNSIPEPFNPDGGMPWLSQRYLYFTGASALDPATRAHLEDFFAYRFSLKTVVHRTDSRLKKAVKRCFMGGNQLRLLRAKLNPLAQISLIKDPIAVFLTEVFLELRPMTVFALVRHPLSYAGSLKRLKWKYKVEPLLSQPELRKRYLYDYPHGDAEPATPLQASAWIWLAINRYILEAAARRPEIEVIFQEELANSPESIVRACYERLALPWSSRVSARLGALTSDRGKAVAREGVVHDFRRASRQIFAHSIGLLSEQERDAVLSITAPLAEQLYVDLARPELTATGAQLMRIQRLTGA